jgi:hypothetical protein
MSMRTLRNALAALLGASLLVALLSGVVAAQVGTAELTLDPDAPAPVHVGDVLGVTIAVQHPAGTVAILPAMGEQWGLFEVRSVAPPTVVEQEDGSLLSSRHMEVSLFAPGLYITPALSVRIADTSGTTWELQPPPLTVPVESLLGEPEPPLRDVKAQATVRAPLWPLVAGGVTALPIVVALLWWFWRRGGVAALGARTPTERALAELSQLAAAGLIQQGRFKEFYLGVAQTMRRQLEREVGLPVEDRTTRELRTLLRRSPLPAETSRRLVELLSECDLVKFSEVTPTPEGATALLGAAREVVREVGATRSAPAPTAAPRPAGSAP